jgi:hypothetical protein
MTEWTVKLPGSDFKLTSEELKIWADAGKIKGDAIVVDSNGVSWTAKQIPGVFSSRDWLVALLLSIFTGVLGVDRFYLGKVGTGITKLLVNIFTLFTLGLIWALIDIILIATRKMTDKEGFKLA